MTGDNSATPHSAALNDKAGASYEGERGGTHEGTHMVTAFPSTVVLALSAWGGELFFSSLIGNFYI